MNINAVARAVQDIGRGILRIQGDDEFDKNSSQDAALSLSPTKVAAARASGQRSPLAKRNEFWAWDIAAWGKEHVQECVNYLLHECESAEEPKRKSIAGRMLLYLVNQRPEATSIIVDMMESLVLKAFQNMAPSMEPQRLVSVANLTVMFANLMPNQEISSKASNLGVVSKVCRRIVRDFDCAAKVIQAFVRKMQSFATAATNPTSANRQKKLLRVMQLQAAQVQYRHAQKTFSYRWPLLLPHLTVLQMATHLHASDYVLEDRTRVLRGGTLIFFEDLLWRVLIVDGGEGRPGSGSRIKPSVDAVDLSSDSGISLPQDQLGASTARRHFESLLAPWKYEARLRILSTLVSVTSGSRKLQAEFLAGSTFRRLLRGGIATKGSENQEKELPRGLLSRNGLLRHESDAHFLECLEWTLRIVHNVSGCLSPDVNSGASEPTKRELTASERRAEQFEVAACDVCDVLLFEGILFPALASGSGIHDTRETQLQRSLQLPELQSRLRRVAVDILRNFCTTDFGCHWFVVHFGQSQTPGSEKYTSAQTEHDSGERTQGPNRMWQLLHYFTSSSLEVQAMKSLTLSVFSTLVHASNAGNIALSSSSRKELVQACLDSIDLAIDSHRNVADVQHDCMAVLYRILAPLHEVSHAFFRILRATNAYAAFIQFLFRRYPRRSAEFYLYQSSVMNFLVQSDLVQSLLRTPDVAACLVQMVEEFTCVMVTDKHGSPTSVELVGKCFRQLFQGFLDAPPRRNGGEKEALLEHQRLQVWQVLLHRRYLDVFAATIHVLHERTCWDPIRVILDILLFTAPLRTPLISVDRRYFIPRAVFDYAARSNQTIPGAAALEQAPMQAPHTTRHAQKLDSSIERVKQLLVQLYFDPSAPAAAPVLRPRTTETAIVTYSLPLFDVLLELVVDAANSETLLSKLFLLMSKVCSSDFTAQLASERGLMDAMVQFVPRGKQLLQKKSKYVHYNKGTFTREVFMKGLSTRGALKAPVPFSNLPPTYYLLLAELARVPVNRDWMSLSDLLRTLLDRPLSFKATSAWDNGFVSNLAILLDRLASSAVEQHGTALDTIIDSKVIELFVQVIIASGTQTQVTASDASASSSVDRSEKSSGSTSNRRPAIPVKTLACTLHALSSLTKDFIRVVPRLISCGGAIFVSSVIDAIARNLPRRHHRGVASVRIAGLLLLQHIARFPQGAYHSLIISGGTFVGDDREQSNGTGTSSMSGGTKEGGMRLLRNIGQDFTQELRQSKDEISEGKIARETLDVLVRHRQLEQKKLVAAMFMHNGAINKLAAKVRQKRIALPCASTDTMVDEGIKQKTNSDQEVLDLQLLVDPVFKVPKAHTAVPIEHLHHRDSMPHPDAPKFGRYYGNSLGHHVKIKAAPSRAAEAMMSSSGQITSSPRSPHNAAQKSACEQQSQGIGFGEDGAAVSGPGVSRSYGSRHRGSSTLRSVFKSSLESVQINSTFSARSP